VAAKRTSLTRPVPLEAETYPNGLSKSRH